MSKIQIKLWILFLQFYNQFYVIFVLFVLQLLKTKEINFLFVKKKTKKQDFFFSCKEKFVKKILKTACYKSFWLCVQNTKNHDRHKYYIKFVKKIVKTRFIVWSDLWSVNRCLECIIWNYGVWKYEIFYFFFQPNCKIFCLDTRISKYMLKVIVLASFKQPIESSKTLPM